MTHTLRLVVAGSLMSSLLLIAAPFVAHASMSVPFGGKIIAIRPCIGAGLFLATIQQAPPKPVIEVMASFSPFLFYQMSHPGQNTLGLLQGPTACWTSPHSFFMVPFTTFYGTSI